MRRLAACFVIPLLLALAPSARAQQADEIVLRLVHQTPWNDLDHTSLGLVVRAVNDTDQNLDDLSLGITIETPVGSRTEYEQSLQGDTGEVVSGTAPPLTGDLSAGSSRRFRVPPVDLTVLAQRAETAIYPMKVELRSHDQPVATLRSPVVFLAKNPPNVPLDLTATYVLSAPILYEPDGTFRTPWLHRQVAHGGSLRAEAEALAKLTARQGAPSFDVAVSPQLTAQLLRMHDGYTIRDAAGTTRVPAGKDGAAGAARILADLRTLARAEAVELSALPYAAPSLPALFDAGLVQDIPAQLNRGRAEIASDLGADPLLSLLHPPGSHVTQGALYELQRNGVETLLVDRDTAVPGTHDPRGFADPAVLPLSVGTGRPLTAVAPGQDLEGILDSALPRQDPHLAVQAVLGELAAIWLERPSSPRGVALMLSERTRVPGYFIGPFVHALAAAPWLRQMTATTLAQVHPPAREPAQLVGPPGPTFSSTYLSALTSARLRIATYREILTADSTLPASLEQLILLAEAGQFATQEYLGEQFLDTVGARLNAQFRQVAPEPESTVTLTQQSGNIPVPIHNMSGQPVKVRVQLQSPGNRLLVHDNSRLVVIPSDGLTLSFGVQARTTGRFPVQVLVTTPDGATTLSRGRLVVRSTAYNRVALVITIGAALFLLALWARRFLPWTKR